MRALRDELGVENVGMLVFVDVGVAGLWAWRLPSTSKKCVGDEVKFIRFPDDILDRHQLRGHQRVVNNLMSMAALSSCRCAFLWSKLLLTALYV